MTKKILIDASIASETRVAILNKNGKLDNFDYETDEKPQIIGNIYLARVIRVEPSLQACFVDYGGDRHGFVAFDSIHPDYYDLPQEDRQHLIDSESQEIEDSKSKVDGSDSDLIIEDDTFTQKVF